MQIQNSNSEFGSSFFRKKICGELLTNMSSKLYEFHIFTSTHKFNLISFTQTLDTYEVYSKKGFPFLETSVCNRTESIFFQKNKRF